MNTLNHSTRIAVDVGRIKRRRRGSDIQVLATSAPLRLSRPAEVLIADARLTPMPAVTNPESPIPNPGITP